MSMTAFEPADLTLEQAMRMIREHAPGLIAKAHRELVRDKSYQETALGRDVAAYLRSKRKRLTDSSERGYEGALSKLALDFLDLTLGDFEMPLGAQRVEEFLDERWGHSAPGTYNVNLSILSDFFKWQIKRGRMHSNPCTIIERARKGQVYRTTFSNSQRRAIMASAEDLRDRIALRLLLDYGIRKGALQKVQFKHFDHQRRRLTIFTKGQKVREMPLPDPAFWMDLERHILDAPFRSSSRRKALQASGFLEPRPGARRP